jgi:hypothetical protein
LGARAAIAGIPHGRALRRRTVAAPDVDASPFLALDDVHDERAGLEDKGARNLPEARGGGRKPGQTEVGLGPEISPSIHDRRTGED